jgi:large subunit ribosomal protein L19
MNKTHDSIKNLLGVNKFKEVKTGWTVRVFQKIKDGEKTRVQAFEGMVISRKHGDTPSGTITVRRIHGGFGMEKIFPIFLPTIEKVEIVKKAKVRSSKIYYLRDKTAKEIRKKVRLEQVKVKAGTNEAATEETKEE